MSEDYLEASCPNMRCPGQLIKNECGTCGTKVKSYDDWNNLVKLQVKPTGISGYWKKVEYPENMVDYLDKE